MNISYVCIMQLGAHHEALQKLVEVLPEIKHKVSYPAQNQHTWKSKTVQRTDVFARELKPSGWKECCRESESRSGILGPTLWCLCVTAILGAPPFSV